MSRALTGRKPEVERGWGARRSFREHKLTLVVRVGPGGRDCQDRRIDIVLPFAHDLNDFHPGGTIHGREDVCPGPSVTWGTPAMVTGSLNENVTGVFAPADPAQAKANASARNVFRAIGMLLKRAVGTQIHMPDAGDPHRAHFFVESKARHCAKS